MKLFFDKAFMPAEHIVDLLIDRGLEIDNPQEASHYIRNIGYYRLSAYMFPFLCQPKSDRRFKDGSKFNDSLNLYRFDKKLRLFLFNEIEKIEIALRSILANFVSEETGNIFWMTDNALFANTDKFMRTMNLVNKELNNTKEEFIMHFKESYLNPYPPAWMLIEILPLGVVTRIYENLADNNLRKKIALRFGLTVPVFSSWLTIITLTRNACCHHARVWNKENAISPKMPRKLNGKWINSKISPKRIFFDICIIKWFIDSISPDNDMLEHLQSLMALYPMVDISAMGFPKNWLEEPLWHVNPSSVGITDYFQ